ncbi:MAG: phosphoglucosamine mutase [Ignavibacteriae bacterium]|nr:MAG: phosphoglucosamine mutase [Ignavibacteriota bacterium]
MKQPIISISGIRGVLGESLTPDNIIRFAAAFAKYIGPKRIVLGRDGRLHGDMIEKIVESTLLMNGCQVINLGIAPTPTITLAVEALKADGGIAVTASHNPQEWNGMKFVNGSGVFLNAQENKDFLSHMEVTSGVIYGWEDVKHIEYYPTFYDYHIKKVLNIKTIDVKKIRKRKFKVLVDCVNSSGSIIVPELLKRLGCKVIKLDCDCTGIFTRRPEPVPENLARTMKAVKKSGADIGIIVDPDADRLVLITEKGKPYGEENTIVTVIKHIMKNSPRKRRIAAVNLSTTRAVDDVVAQHGGQLYKSPVGEINVIGKMKEHNAVVGGEGSGGVILREVHYGRDSLVGIAVILSELAEFNGTVSEYKNTLPQYVISKNKIDVNKVPADKIIKFIKRKFKGYPVNEEDGLRVDFEDSWMNFRKSNTEPIIRIISEAKTIDKAEALQMNIMNEINEFITGNVIEGVDNKWL